MAKINGSDFVLYIDDVAVALSTSCTVSSSTDTIDITTKDSDGYADFLSGLKSGDVSFEALADFSGEDAVFTAYNADATVDFSLTDGASSSAGNRYTGSGLLTAVDITYDMESTANYSGTITLTTDITPTFT